MKLLVDVGNSRIKWACLRGGRLEAGAGFERREPLEGALDEVWGKRDPPSAVLVSSVADRDFEARLGQWMADRWGRPPDWFRSEPETLGIANGYSDASRLGSDRWAAVVGAAGRYPGPFGVIDAGTAITLDVVDADRRHLGGLILPGPRLAAHSLTANTANIRELSPESGAVLGRSTGECVASGIRLGLAGAMVGWTGEVERLLGELAWVATGGAWPLMSPELARPVHYDPDLVLKGLARVLGWR